MARRGWGAGALAAAMGVAGLVGLAASGAPAGAAVSRAATQDPCSLLSAAAIKQVLGEPVQAGTPSQYVPEMCEYPLTPTTDLPRDFTVLIEDAAQCLDAPIKGVTVIKVGKAKGFYDVRSRQSTPKTELHSPSVSVTKRAHCLELRWVLPDGPLPSGSRAQTVQRKLVTLESRALKKFQG